jgi:serine protease Do
MRARRLILVAVCALACACASKKGPAAPRAPLTPAEIAERSLPSVVLIRGPDRIGTGFIIWQDGRIATNLHVIYGARDLEVELPGGRVVRGIEVMATDEAHDLAVIRVPVRDLPALDLGDSDTARPGQRVVAIGHPLGLGDTVSDGLISAVRTVGPGTKVLQISAPIAQGSSGGPVFDDKGAVLGVAFLVSREGQNLNFAIPVNYLKPLLLDDSPEAFADFARRTAGPRERGRGNAPKIVRQVPQHPVALLQDCAIDQLALAFESIGDAISLGAPLYNEGNHAACFKIYEGTALALEGQLAVCTGVKQALAAGRARAATLTSDTEKAWAMRDAFDGLLQVIQQRAQQP